MSEVRSKNSGSRPAPESMWFVVLLGAITALAPLGIDTSLPALPMMTRALQTSDGLIAATLGSFMLAFALGQLLVGPLSDVYGRRPVIVAGIALFTVAGVACAAAVDARVLVVARFAQGFGACAGAAVGRAMIRDLFTDVRRAAQMQSYTSAISGVVPMLAPLLGVALLPYGWRAIYFALIVGGGVLLGATAMWLPESLPPAANRSRPARIIARYRQFTAMPRTLAMCLVLASSFAGLFAFISGSPFVLIRELGLSNTAYGVAFAFSAGSILAGSWLAGVCARRAGPERVLRLACAGAGCAGVTAFGFTVLAGHPPSAATFTAIMAGYAFTFGAIVPTAFAIAMDGAGEMAGVASGLLGATQMLGGAAGSVINGALPFKTSFDIGLSAGVAGISVIAAYALSSPPRVVQTPAS